MKEATNQPTKSLWRRREEKRQNVEKKENKIIHNRNGTEGDEMNRFKQQSHDETEQPKLVRKA